MHPIHGTGLQMGEKLSLPQCFQLARSHALHGFHHQSVCRQGEGVRDQVGSLFVEFQAGGCQRMSVVVFNQVQNGARKDGLGHRIVRFPINLRIHQVAGPNKHRRQRHGNDKPVHHPQIGLPNYVFGIPEHGNQNGRSCSVAGQASFPNVQNLDQVVLVIGPIVKEYMPQTRTYHRSRHHRGEQGVQLILGKAGRCKPLAHLPVSQEKPARKQQTVVAQRKKAEVQTVFRGPGKGGRCQHALKVKNQKVYCSLLGFVFFGTGSYPDVPHGWHLERRRSPIQLPRNAPHSRIESTMYAEQVGVCLHDAGVNGEIT